VRFSATPGNKSPEPIAVKLGVRNYVLGPTLTSKYGSDRAARGYRRMREISLFVTFLFFVFVFGFFNSPTGRHSGPIFTIYTVSQKNCASVIL